MIPTTQIIAEEELRGMESQAVLLFLIAVAYSFALPTCSPIIPPDTDTCENPMNNTTATDFVRREIFPRLDDIRNNLSRVLNDSALANIEGSRGPYQLDNRTTCQRSGDDNRDTLYAADCISSSVYRFKCEVQPVAEIVKNETIRKLVEEESNFATEYQSILKDLDVLEQLKKLVSSDRRLNSCNVPENACAEFTYPGRLELVKSISEDLYRLVDDVTTALQGYYYI